MTAEGQKFAIEMLTHLVGGLGIFLFGMKNMSEGMQAIAGDRLRKLISSVTSNRFSACGVGTLVTSLVQSSSVTTVMTIGFVTAGFMTLTQAIGVILGANIGTTITAWILVLPVGKAGLPILGIAAFFYLFSKNEKVRFWGMAIMGVGMVFFGLELMSQGFKPMRTMPEFREWFLKFSAADFSGIIKCVLVGCILTCIVQSSSATIGITMGLAATGMIDFRTAAALVLGENIGTTITALFASIGAPVNARRAAYSHVLFNCIGVVWITLLFGPYVDAVEKVVAFLSGHPGTMEMIDGKEAYPFIKQGIAFVHSGFNIINTLIFLPLVPVLAKVVMRLVPDDETDEVPHLSYLDIRMIDSPAIAIEQSHNEIVLMSDHVSEMLNYLREIISSEKADEKMVKRVFHREEILDGVQKEVTEFLGHILSSNISNDIVDEARIQLRMADEYESLSDYVANVLKLYLKKSKNKIMFPKEGWKDILALHDQCTDYVAMVNDAVKNNFPEVITKARSQGEGVSQAMKECRTKHLERVGTEQDSPLASLIFTDMLNAYRRMKDHCLNIAEAVAGEK